MAVIPSSAVFSRGWFTCSATSPGAVAVGDTFKLSPACSLQNGVIQVFHVLVAASGWRSVNPC